jgi:hypothetical protein
MLLVVAGVVLLASLFGLVGMLTGGGGAISGLGVFAALVVFFRMVDPPNPADAYVAFSLSWGIWLALGAAAVVTLGGMWSPR